MATKVIRMGNRVGVRLPKAAALEIRMAEGNTVAVSVKNGAVNIRPARRTYSLHELVSKITPRNRHDEIGW